jgi:hypothetical protein
MRHVNQVVGHSPGKYPREHYLFGDLKEKESKDPKFLQYEDYHTGFAYPASVDLYQASRNLCLDTYNRHIGILEDGNLSVIDNPITLPPEPEPPAEVLAEQRKRQEERMRRILESVMLHEAFQAKT